MFCQRHKSWLASFGASLISLSRRPWAARFSLAWAVIRGKLRLHYSNDALQCVLLHQNTAISWSGGRVITLRRCVLTLFLAALPVRCPLLTSTTSLCLLAAPTLFLVALAFNFLTLTALPCLLLNLFMVADKASALLYAVNLPVANCLYLQSCWSPSCSDKDVYSAQKIRLLMRRTRSNC